MMGWIIELAGSAGSHHAIFFKQSHEPARISKLSDNSAAGIMRSFFNGMGQTGQGHAYVPHADWVQTAVGIGALVMVSLFLQWVVGPSGLVGR
jgi:hypothetical protein